MCEDQIFVIGGLLWVASGMLVGWWMVRAQIRYIRLQREIGGRSDLPSPDDHEGSSTLLTDLGASGRLWDVIWEEQSNRELEAVRQEAARRQKIGAAYVIGVPVILFVILSLA